MPLCPCEFHSYTVGILGGPYFNPQQCPMEEATPATTARQRREDGCSTVLRQELAHQLRREYPLALTSGPSRS